MAIEIVDFPMKNGGSFHSKMLVYQRLRPFLVIDVHKYVHISYYIHQKKQIMANHGVLLWGNTCTKKTCSTCLFSQKMTGLFNFQQVVQGFPCQIIQISIGKPKKIGQISHSPGQARPMGWSRHSVQISESAVWVGI